MTDETFRFSVGRFACIAIHDGDASYTANRFFINAPAEELDRALRAHGVDPMHIPSPYSGLVIDTGTQRVLVDTGAGGLAPGTGRLRANLLTAGIAPETIDTVILTHGHPDHLGGTTDAAGNVVFRNARHVISRDEWAYWMSDAGGDDATIGPAVAFVRANLAPLAGQIDLLDPETEIVPGIRALAAPGHTPGQIALAVASEDEELLYISDAALHPIHLEFPDWYSDYDRDPPRAIATKRQLFAHAAARSLVLAFHFAPFPSLGHAVACGAGWRWVPGHTPTAEFS